MALPIQPSPVPRINQHKHYHELSPSRRLITELAIYKAATRLAPVLLLDHRSQQTFYVR